MRNGCSDRLYRADERFEPETIFQLVEGEVAEEIEPYLNDPDVGEQLATDRDTILAGVMECRALYSEHQDHDEAYRRMCASLNPWSQAIGRALQTGVYRELAL